MKLKNGWLHKKSYQKAIIYSAVVLVGAIGFCCYELFGRNASTLMVILYAFLGFLFASLVFTTFYSKDMREFSDKISQVYMSMDPAPFYEWVQSLDFSILAEETKTKIAFFTAWFKHFEGNNEEAKEMFYAKAIKPFPFTNMLSLKALIEIYLLDDKNEGYTVVKNTLLELEEAKVAPKVKQQLEQEIKGQVLRLDVINSGEADEEVINSLKQSVAPFEYVQNQCFLTYLLKNKDPKTAYECKEYVLQNYGKFLEYKNIVEKIDIDFDPVKWKEEHPEVEESNLIENNEEVNDSNVIENENTEDIKEEVKEDKE